MRGTTPLRPVTRSLGWNTSGRFFDSLTTHCRGSSTRTSAPLCWQASTRRRVEYNVALRDRMAIFIRGLTLPFRLSRRLPAAAGRPSPRGWPPVPASQAVFARDVDAEVPLQSLAPEDHAKEHAGAVGQSEEDTLAHRPEHHLGFDDRPRLRMAAGVGDAHPPQHFHPRGHLMLGPATVGA